MLANFFFFFYQDNINSLIWNYIPGNNIIVIHERYEGMEFIAGPLFQ